MAWVGLCRGWIARSTFEPAICACAANSLTPIARITFPEGGLDRNALFHGREEEIARELGVAKVLGQSLVPVSAGSWHVTCRCITAMAFGTGQSAIVVF